MKYSIIKNDIIDLAPKKHISWEDDNINLQFFEEENRENKVIEDDIFKKLKKIEPQTDVSSNMNMNINDRMDILEDKLEALNSKIDLLIKLLQP